MRPFFLRIVRKGKRNYKTKQERKDKAREQAKESRHRNTMTKGQKLGKRIKPRAKRIKRKANTQQAIKPPNTSRTQKPHKPRKARKQYKHTSNKGNPPKTPKNANKGIFQGQHTKDKARELTKGRNTRQEDQRRHSSGPAPSKACNQWTPPPPQRENQNESPAILRFKYILNFALFGLRFSRENTKHPQNFIHFCPFLPRLSENPARLEKEREEERGLK